ncbi:MAG: GvpL/GvpF family gas vesicle protein [Pseudomonadota bacterium]
MSKGYYLYCIIDSVDDASLGPIGIEESSVITISNNNISAVVHPVESGVKIENSQESLKWVAAHQSVVEEAWKRYKTILPFAFGTIIRGDENKLRIWMERENDRLVKKMFNVRDKAEYGVQIFWCPSRCIEKVVNSKNDLMELKKKSEGESTGTAYMYKKRYEKALKDEMEHKATELFRVFFKQIKQCVSNITVEKIKRLEGDKQMLLNVSCLSDAEQVKKLGDLLEDIGQCEDHTVRFTGPWPPYSFVGI